MAVVVRSQIPAEVRKPHEDRYREALRRQLELPDLTKEARESIVAALRAVGCAKKQVTDSPSPQKKEF